MKLPTELEKKIADYEAGLEARGRALGFSVNIKWNDEVLCRMSIGMLKDYIEQYKAVLEREVLNRYENTLTLKLAGLTGSSSEEGK